MTDWDNERRLKSVGHHWSKLADTQFYCLNTNVSNESRPIRCPNYFSITFELDRLSRENQIDVGEQKYVARK